MSPDNRLSIVITPAQKAAIEAAATALKAAFQDLLISLNPGDKATLPKIGDRTLAFHEKCTAERAAHPELTPSFTDLAELNKDLAAVAVLLPCQRIIQPICDMLSDTITLAYSECYTQDLAFYNNVKLAAANNVPGAQTIYEELKVRFPGRPKPAAPTPTP